CLRNTPGSFRNREVHFWLERAVAISKKNAQVEFTRVCYREVQLAVAIVVGNGDMVWTRSSLVKHSRLKRSIAISKENSNVVACRAVSDCQVELSISIKISHSYEFREATGRIIYSGLKASVAVAEQDAHSAVIYVSHRDVEVAIAIKISQG